jgi:hypothetical protein
MKRIIWGIIVFGIIIGAGLMLYMGVFTRVTKHILEKDMGPYKLVYVEQKGSYEQTQNTIQKLTDSLEAQGISAYKGFSIYYDDEKKTPKENLHSDVGCLLKKEDCDKIDTMKFKVKEFQMQHCVVANFSYRIGLSVLLGKMKVYPALEIYLKNRHYNKIPLMELYGPKSITYIVPISYQ